MFSKLACTCLAAFACTAAFGQPARFEIADVHVTPKDLANPFMEANPPRNGRYEFHSASMIDLIRVAYLLEEDKILGGPSWLERDRFEVTAKVPAETSTAVPSGSAPGTLSNTVREMLQSLLTDRFKLVIVQENRPLRGYVLTDDKKPQMKEGDGSGDRGCKFISQTDPADTTLRFSCRNQSMDSLAAMLSGFLGAPPGGVLNKSEMKGVWNFDLKLPRNTPPDGENGTAALVGRQLGVKLEPQPIPTPVAVVESVNETPTANIPAVAEALPIAPQPTAFDVATFRPTDPSYPGSTGSLGPKPGGLWVSRGVTLYSLLVRAFSPSYVQKNDDLVAGVPGWVAGVRFDITAKSPPDASASARAGPMVRSLLEERLKLKWHTEERPISVYILVAAKPKMKKADPASRTHCRQIAAPAGSPPNSISLSCQNVTMEQFAEDLRPRLQGTGSPVLDSTGIVGGWDFILTYSYSRGPVNPSDLDQGLTIQEAMEKQLGLKLETQKRPAMVTVIDHMEQTPTDN